MNPLKNGEITVEYENDVWSLGTMFYEVYTSEKLFDGICSSYFRGRLQNNK